MEGAGHPGDVRLAPTGTEWRGLYDFADNYKEKYEQGVEQEKRQSALRMIEARRHMEDTGIVASMFGLCQRDCGKIPGLTVFRKKGKKN